MPINSNNSTPQYMVNISSGCDKQLKTKQLQKSDKERTDKDKTVYPGFYSRGIIT